MVILSALPEWHSPWQRSVHEQSLGLLHLFLACTFFDKGFLYYRVLKGSLFKHTWGKGQGRHTDVFVF